MESANYPQNNMVACVVGFVTKVCICIHKFAHANQEQEINNALRDPLGMQKGISAEKILIFRHHPDVLNIKYFDAYYRDENEIYRT